MRKRDLVMAALAASIVGAVPVAVVVLILFKLAYGGH